MVSKKRTGNDPEAIAARERELRGISEAAGGRGGQVGLRGASEAFQAGRRSMAYELVESGGLAESRLGLEILYLLPDDFVVFYEQLFHKALGVGDNSVMHGRSGGLEKASGRTSMQLGTEDRGPQAQSSGKRWKKTAMIVTDDGALRIKEGVDQGLRDLAKDARSAWGRINEERKAMKEAEISGVSGVSEFGGSPASPEPHVSRAIQNGKSQGREGTGGTGGKGGRASQCQGTLEISATLGTTKRPCRRFLKATWEFCPSCGHRVMG